MLKSLEQRFPEWQAVIKRLRQVDPDFRAVCQEYEETARALAFWIRLSKLSLREIKRQKAATQELLHELETDIRMMLEHEVKIAPSERLRS